MFILSKNRLAEKLIAMASFSEEEVKKFQGLFELWTNMNKSPEGESGERKDGGKKSMGKDFEKKVHEFDGEVEGYGNWSFKVKNAMKRVNPRCAK